MGWGLLRSRGGGSKTAWRFASRRTPKRRCALDRPFGKWQPMRTARFWSAPAKRSGDGALDGPGEDWRRRNQVQLCFASPPRTRCAPGRRTVRGRRNSGPRPVLRLQRTGLRKDDEGNLARPAHSQAPDWHPPVPSSPRRDRNPAPTVAGLATDDTDGTDQRTRVPIREIRAIRGSKIGARILTAPGPQPNAHRDGFSH